jgi:hypothetical protein
MGLTGPSTRQRQHRIHLVRDSFSVCADLCAELDGAVGAAAEAEAETADADVVLLVQPFSMANKGNSARDSVVWNRLWRLVSACASELVEYFFQVRTVEGLSATTSTKDVPLTRTAELLGLADGGGKGLWRYFLGLRRNKFPRWGKLRNFAIPSTV